MLKIAIDSGTLSGGHAVRGVGTYTRELVKAAGELKLNEIKIEAIDFKEADLSKYDLVHYPYFDLFFHTLPLKKTTKTIVTLHDVTPLIYPEHYPPGLKGKINFNLQKQSLKNVNAIITDSETSKKDIVRFLKIKADKIEVVHLAASKRFKKVSNPRLFYRIKHKYRLPEKFVLYVGDINYNKNILGLVLACKIAKIALVIVGKQAKEIETVIESEKERNKSITKPQDLFRNIKGQLNPEIEHWQQLVKLFKNSNTISRLGFVPEEDLMAIYNLATVYCQPSFYEGFGLPILEAISCGTPVVAAKTQALVEIAEGGVLLTDPKDPIDIADKLTKLYISPSLQEVYRKLGLNLVKKYTWEKTVKLTIDVYKKVLARN